MGTPAAGTPGTEPGEGTPAAGNPGTEPGEGTPAAGTPGTEPGEGGSITVMSLWGGSEQEAFQEVLDAFEQESGVTVTYESVREDYSTALTTSIQAGSPPDVAIIPGIGFLRRFAAENALVPVQDLGIDVAALEDNYAPGILDIGTVDGTLYGIMVKFNSKSTMWYRPDQFQELGVEPAETWEDFESLLASIRDQGQTPMALGAADDWTLTDWFENIYLRQAGPEAYDQLFSAEGDWTDQSVRDAIDSMTSVLSEENVVGGINGALGTGFVDAIGQVFGPTPQAPIYYEGGFVGGIATGQVNPDLEIGQTIDWFDFPTINGGDGVTIGGDVIAAFTSEPGVAEFIQFMTEPASGEVWAGTGAIISPIRGVSGEVYPNELVQREAEQVANASAVRFDGADLHPAGAPELGALLQDAVRGQDMGPALESYNQQIQSAWADE
jgi:ABC-type glycerol-3-phosphate transport system substrate-binding protein